MPIIRFRFRTNIVSATKLFAGQGRPKFFSLLTAQTAEAVKSAGMDFSTFRRDKAFRESLQTAFEEFKKWFFGEVVPKYCLQKGDLFSIVLDAEVDTDTKTISFRYDTAEVTVWHRATSSCGDADGCEARLRECESRLAECEKKIESLKNLLS